MEMGLVQGEVEGDPVRSEVWTRRYEGGDALSDFRAALHRSANNMYPYDGLEK